MRAFVMAVVCVTAWSACRSGPSVTSYPGTDIPVFEQFRLQTAQGVQKTGQQFREGELRYIGQGEIPELMRTYADAMRDRGWVQTTADVNRDRGTSRFRKDDRAALIELNRQADDNVFVIVRVKQAADPQVR